MEKPKQKKVYSLIWQQFGKDSQTGRHLGAERDFALPFFIDGPDKAKFDVKREVQLGNLHLLRGLLLGYHDSPPTVDLEYAKSLFPRILNDLIDFFKMENLETMILNIASFMREQNGDAVSFQALLAGEEILPDSSKIKFDCAIDLYNMLERNEFGDTAYGMKKLKELLSAIDDSKINQTFIYALEEMKQFKPQK